MRIALVGSHSVGKTSVAKQLSEALNISYIQEQARISCEKFNVTDLDEFRKNVDLYSTFQYDILRRQINTELKYFNTGFVTDRSTCDIFAYYTLNNNDSNFIFEKYKQLALSYYEDKHTYNLVVYFPIMFPLVDDGLRNKDEEYRKEIDKIIKRYMHMNPNVYCLQSDGVENRVKELTEVINKWKIK